MAARSRAVSDLGHVLRLLVQNRRPDESLRFTSSPSLASPAAPGRLLEIRNGNRISRHLERAVCVLMGAQGTLPPYMLEEAAQDSTSNFTEFMQVLEHHLGQKLADVFCVTHDLADEHRLPARDVRRLLGISEWDQLSAPLRRALARGRPFNLTCARSQPGSAEGFRMAISQLLGQPVQVLENDPGHMRLPDTLCGRLGRNLELGGHHVLGQRVRNDANRIRLTVRCSHPDEARSLAPGGLRHAQLRELAGLAAGRPLQVVLVVALEAGSVSAGALGQTRLGQGAVLGERNRFSQRHYSLTVIFQGGEHEY